MTSRIHWPVLFTGLMLPLTVSPCAIASQANPWPMHFIDNSGQGADGVRLADVNSDGLQDITTAWEESGDIRVYLNPGPEKARKPWPSVTVGQLPSPEDAVFADLDGDGSTDVISSCEGQEKTLYVHWAPREASDYLDAASWKTEALPVSRGMTRWMFSLPLQIDGRHGVDLISGAKDKNARIGWFQAPALPRDLSAWSWHPLYQAGWIMSLLAEDMDGDGDLDILASDRYGPTSGCLWLENPGPSKALAGPWDIHRIGETDIRIMFINVIDLDGDGLRDILAAVKPREIQFHRRITKDGLSWKTQSIPIPERAGTAKAVNAADMDLDGRMDLVFTCEEATDEKSGVMGLSYNNSISDATWTAWDISGAPGTKYDLVELIDLDSDGDLDVLTCEEKENLGVIWYENPARE